MIKLPLQLTEAQYIDHTEMDEGICLACGETQGCCEPDAEGYTCDSCEEDKVMAFEQLMVEGNIVLLDDENAE